MVRKTSLYTVVLFAWALLVFGATVAVFSGQAAPLVTLEMLPVSGPIGLFAFAGGLLVVGAVGITLMKRRAWRRAGARANLTPQGGGLLGNPALVGTADGRPVRARTIKQQTSGGGEGGSRKSTFTVVEADLGEPATEGLVISPGGGDTADIGDVPVNLETETVGEFAVVGNSEGLARDTLTTRARNELREPALLESVLVGNASDVLLEAVPDSDGRLAGALTDGIERKIREKMAGDAGTVRIKTKGMILDSEELDRQVTAVAAVADGFESATAG